MLAAGGLDPAARRKALRYWVDYARKYGGDHKNAYQTFNRLEAEWPNLEAVAGTLRDLARLPGPVQDREAAEMLNDLALAVSYFLFFRGYWDERVRLGEWAYAATRGLGNWSEAGWRAHAVAFIHYYRAETERAATWTERCAEAWERGGRHRDRAVATRLRGLLAEQRGDLDEAERLGREALAAHRNLKGQDDEAIILSDLGELARQRQNYDRAEAYYRQALDLAEKLGNKEYQATRLGNLGGLALDRNRPDEARCWYERTLALAQEVGRHDLVASAQHGLARVLEEKRRYAEALSLAEQALQIYERLRAKDLPKTRDLVARLRNRSP
jgi:tetratricopeptide (TPR) repeat protein